MSEKRGGGKGRGYWSTRDARRFHHKATEDDNYIDRCKRLTDDEKGRIHRDRENYETILDAEMYYQSL